MLNRAMFRNFMVFLAIGIFSIFFVLNDLAAEDIKTFKIGLAVLKDNPDYQATRKGFVSVIEKTKDMKYEFRFLDAYGDIAAYKAGLGRLVKVDKVDLIFTTGTRSTQPAVEIVKDIPLIFSAVAAPIEAGIVTSLGPREGSNITGTHCGVPAYAQVKTIKRVFPNVGKIGIIYTKDEKNAEVQCSDFIKAAKRLGIEVLVSHVSKDCKTEEEVEEAAKKLVGKVDILVALQDTSLALYGKGMIKAAEENKIPTYVSLGQLLDEGALFSLGIDFESIGRMAGEQAISILRDNVNAGDIKVETDERYSLEINLAASKKIGVDIPVQILRTATRLIQ